MANRPVFEVMEHAPFFRRMNIDFEFYNGFSIQQKQRCIRSLHGSYVKLTGNDKTLEVSSKSENPLGIALSAFNLSIVDEQGKRMTVESLFQGSKVFQYDQETLGPYTDIYTMSSLEAHKDIRLYGPGRIRGFRYFDQEFPINPPTYFFDWLYVNALHQNPDLAEKVIKYKAFTDIEFNPLRQINCQAEAAAIYVGLWNSGKLDEALKDKGTFKSVVFEE